jgi:exonuclease SbcC
MRLKSIKLNNIRSYNSETIEFPEGSTLLSGDIGSGKTSILLAIEFALFGLQPGQRGSSLLRNGESLGGVTINFEVDGKDLIIERTLKRGKSISQDYCSITIDGQKSEISVTELKDRILDVLNYPKEFAKKQNLLYRFTVYTPQEEMKQIILQDSETRTNTLRHVFGIDKYKKILENLTILIQKIREEKRIKQAITENLQQDQLDVVSKESDLENKYYNLASVEKELFLKKEARKKVEEDMQEVSKKVEEKRNIEKEIEKTKLVIIHKKDSITINLKLLDTLNSQIKELEDLRFDESKIREIELKVIQLKKEKHDLSEKNLDVSSKISSLNLKNQESENIKQKLQHLEICPTCLQDVDPNYRANVSNKLDSDIYSNVKEIENLVLEKRKISDRINKIEYEISTKERESQDMKILKVKLEQLEDRKKRSKEILASNLMLEKDTALLDNQVKILKATVFDMNKYGNLFEEKQKQLEIARKEERTADIKVAELKKEIEVFTRQIEEIKLKLERISLIKKELEKLVDIETWLNKKFAPMISFVEKNVMVKLKHEFSNLFARWFAMLVSENFTVKLRDDFTPVIEQQDYEIDYEYLSGGERTAVALAYRLALNQVINSLLSKIKTRDLVILDEPTDGFSEQQLDKMREVLEQLDVGQLIIVSHEQKIEGFVENVIRFSKENTFSRKN